MNMIDANEDAEEADMAPLSEIIANAKRRKRPLDAEERGALSELEELLRMNSPDYKRTIVASVDGL